MAEYLYKKLVKYSEEEPAAFHMPGHKLGRSIGRDFLSSMVKIDLTEIPGTDNLHHPEGIIKDAQDNAAKIFGADKTYFLINGSTCGIQSMLTAICPKGGKLILSRDCHKSVINTIAFWELEPVFIDIAFDGNKGIPLSATCEAVKKAVEESPDAAAVLLTRPTYYGICCELEEISQVVHKKGMILAVDEAHGSHFIFSRQLPPSALECGADICVQSAHKTLPAFTQTALLHIKGTRINVVKLEKMLSSFQTSSPSYILMSSLDYAVNYMDTRGRRELERLIALTGSFKNDLRQLKYFRPVETQDITRLVIDCRASGFTGFQTDTMLREKYHIQVEMSDLNNIVCICTIGNNEKDFERLYKALIDLEKEVNPHQSISDINLKYTSPCLKLKPYECLEKEGNKVLLEKSEGKVCLEAVTPYPPGIPAIIPGEEITREIIDYLNDVRKAGGVINGIDENGFILTMADMI